MQSLPYWTVWPDDIHLQHNTNLTEAMPHKQCHISSTHVCNLQHQQTIGSKPLTPLIYAPNKCYGLQGTITNAQPYWHCWTKTNCTFSIIANLVDQHQFKTCTLLTQLQHRGSKPTKITFKLLLWPQNKGSLQCSTAREADPNLTTLELWKCLWSRIQSKITLNIRIAEQGDNSESIWVGLDIWNRSGYNVRPYDQWVHKSLHVCIYKQCTSPRRTQQPRKGAVKTCPKDLDLFPSSYFSKTSAQKQKLDNQPVLAYIHISIKQRNQKALFGSLSK